jgi:hypothetical protein
MNEHVKTNLFKKKYFLNTDDANNTGFFTIIREEIMM